MTKKLLIFDMDGTILYTLEDIVICMNVSLEKYGLPPIGMNDMKAHIGNGILSEVKYACRDAETETVQKVFTEFNKKYAEHCRDHTRPYDGIPETLQILRKRGYVLAVVSNKGDYAVQELCDQYFPDLFDFALGEKEGIRRKPAPDMCDACLNHFPMKKEEAVYIGDSEVDLQTAENSQLDCIVCAWGYRTLASLQEHGAKHIISEVKDLLQIFV